MDNNAMQAGAIQSTLGCSPPEKNLTAFRLINIAFKKIEFALFCRNNKIEV